MPRTLRAHLTYANVVSSLCLFLLLGTGVAWAATTLTSNSVGAAHIKANAVGASEIKKSAVGGSEVKNGSLKAVEFAPGVLLQGAQGQPGQNGEAGQPGQPGQNGANGATNVVIRRGAVATVQPDMSNTSVAECDPGQRATGGGFRMAGNTLDFINPDSSPAPAGVALDGGTPTGWTAQGTNRDVNGDNMGTLTVQAHAICAAP
jgi:hypothetical protein